MTRNGDGRRDRLDALAVVLLVTCSAIWGVAQVAAKVTLHDVPPLLQAAARSVGAALLLLLWSRWRALPLMTADGTGRAGLLAGALFAAEFACIFSGLQFTSASRMAVFIYLAPFFVALGMPFISRHETARPSEGLTPECEARRSDSERLGAVPVAGLLLAFGGVVWAFAEGFTLGAGVPRQWLGDALGIAAAALWALTTLTLRGSRLSGALPEKALMYQLVVSGVALLLGSVLAGEPWPRAIGATELAALVFQIVVVTFASYLSWFWLVRHYPATRISAFTLLTPGFGLLAGVVLLGEPLTARLLVALGAVCLGIGLVSQPPRKS